jgi:hypothetical protein
VGGSLCFSSYSTGAEPAVCQASHNEARIDCLLPRPSPYPVNHHDIDMVTQAVSTGMDPAKPIVIALGRNYKGARASLGDRWTQTPVCKAVLDILKRHFMVVLIDEYLMSQMCDSCHNKLIPQFGEPREKYCTDCKCVT